MKTKLVSAASLTALALIASPAAHAALIAYEGFNYTEDNGTSVAGLNGGTGWLNAFPTPSGAHTLADGLTFQTLPLPQVGKSMVRTGGELTSGLTIGRQWATSVDTTATYWYSFLVNTVGGPEGTFNLFQSTGSNQNGAGIEVRKNADTGLVDIRVTGNGGWNLVSIVAQSQTHLVLGNISNTGNKMWVYASGTDAPTVEPTLGGVTNSGAVLAGKESAMNGRRFGSSNPGSSITFDEVRIGTTFGSVIIPEPSAAALGLLGAVGLMCRRRH